MKILIVDDSRLVRIKLKAELYDRGHTVVEACDGEEALRHLADKSPDAVFLDIILPKLDGCEVLRRLRETHPHIPVVMISTAASAENMAYAEKCGALMFIQKPYSDHEITAALAKMRQCVEGQ